MGYHYVRQDAPRPFAPAKIDFAKKKAKELQRLVPGIKLSESQAAIANALGWSDWYSLDQAVSRGAPPSPSDELVDEEEVHRRRFAQFDALWTGLNLHPTSAEDLAARLGLTCTAATSRKWQAEVGPWGAFQEPPDQIAPGLQFGACAKFHCFRLSAELQASMHPLCRVNSWFGWYMADDHDWRVILSFPQHFSSERVRTAWDDLSHREPFVYQLLSGQASSADGDVQPDAMHQLTLEALRNPDGWFAFSLFEDWAFEKDTRSGYPERELVAVSAMQGRDLGFILDPSRGPDRGTFSERPVRWFVLRTGDLRHIRMPLYVPVIPLDGLKGWPSPPVAKVPFKQQLFSVHEIDFVSCLGFDATFDRLSVSGGPVPIA